MFSAVLHHFFFQQLCVSVWLPRRPTAVALKVKCFSNLASIQDFSCFTATLLLLSTFFFFFHVLLYSFNLWLQSPDVMLRFHYLRSSGVDWLCSENCWDVPPICSLSERFWISLSSRSHIFRASCRLSSDAQLEVEPHRSLNMILLHNVDLQLSCWIQGVVLLLPCYKIPCFGFFLCPDSSFCIKNWHACRLSVQDFNLTHACAFTESKQLLDFCIRTILSVGFLLTRIIKEDFMLYPFFSQQK